MKKAISILWIILIVAIVVFIISVSVAGSDGGIWRVFSITIPIVGISFLGIIILTVMEYLRSRKK